MPSEAAVKIVVPDDFPPALTGSVAEAPLGTRAPRLAEPVALALDRAE